MLVYDKQLQADGHLQTMGLHSDNARLDGYRRHRGCKLAQSYCHRGKLQRSYNFHGASKVFPYLPGHHMGLINDGLVHYLLVPSGTKRY